MRKYNFNIDLAKKNVSVEVSTSIFPVATIIRAAYHFIEEAKVIIDRDQTKEKIIVTFILEGNQVKESDLEELAYEFNIQLIGSFLEDVESQRHAGLREALMKAAISPRERELRPQGPPPPKSPPSKDNRQGGDKH